MKKITIKVSGMSCAHCEKAVITALEDIGIIDASASAKEQKVELSYDPAKLTLEDIEKEITEAGYEIK